MKMSLHFSHGWKHRITLIAPAVFVMVAAFYASSQVPANRKQPSQSPDTVIQQAPILLVQPQQNVPVNITSIEVDASNPLSPRLSFAVSNTSNKPIRAFAISQNAASADKQWSGSSILLHMTSLKDILQPTQSKPVTSAGDTYMEPLKSITLSVDFVEFMDGTTWGADIYKSAERLAGQRAGARAAKARFLKIKGERGSSALIDMVISDEVDIVPPQGHSSAWVSGFRTGSAAVRERLRRAKDKGGLDQIELELRQPFDASEGRQNQ